jgi:hypothetical protein
VTSEEASPRFDSRSRISSAFFGGATEKTASQHALTRLWSTDQLAEALPSRSAATSPLSSSTLLRGYSDAGFSSAGSNSDVSALMAYRQASAQSGAAEQLAVAAATMDSSNAGSTSQSLMELLRAAMAFQTASADAALHPPNTALPTYSLATQQDSTASAEPAGSPHVEKRPATLSPPPSVLREPSGRTTPAGNPSVLSMFGQTSGSQTGCPPVVDSWRRHIIDPGPDLASQALDLPRPISADMESPIRPRRYSTAPSSTLMRANSVLDSELAPSDSVSSVGSPHRAKSASARRAYAMAYEPGALSRSSDVAIPLRSMTSGPRSLDPDSPSQYSNDTPINPFADHIPTTSPLVPRPRKQPQLPRRSPSSAVSAPRSFGRTSFEDVA